MIFFFFCKKGITQKVENSRSKYAYNAILLTLRCRDILILFHFNIRFLSFLPRFFCQSTLFALIGWLFFVNTALFLRTILARFIFFCFWIPLVTTAGWVYGNFPITFNVLPLGVVLLNICLWPLLLPKVVKLKLVKFPTYVHT